MPVSSDSIALGPVAARQSSFDVWDVTLCPALPGVVGTWFGTGLPDLTASGCNHGIRITDDMMTLEIGDRVPYSRSRVPTPRRRLCPR
jgi:hypothetical protein